MKTSSRRPLKVTIATSEDLTQRGANIEARRAGASVRLRKDHVHEEKIQRPDRRGDRV